MFLQHWVRCWYRRPSVEQTIGAAEPPHPLIIAYPDQLRAAATHVVTLIMPSEMVSFCGLMGCMM